MLLVVTSKGTFFKPDGASTAENDRFFAWGDGFNLFWTEYASLKEQFRDASLRSKFSTKFPDCGLGMCSITQGWSAVNVFKQRPGYTSC